MIPPSLSLTAIPGVPMVEPGDDLTGIVLSALDGAGLALQAGDVLVLAQKIVSKAEGRYVHLDTVQPSKRARQLAMRCDKDPRLVELILREAKEVLRVRPGIIIVAHRLGYVHANAGIDRSNIASDDADPRVLLLPEDPDRSAARLRETIGRRCGVAPAVIINDSAGRAWRNGTLGFAIGSAGLTVVESRVGECDLFGRPLEVTEIAVADELAAAASFVMGQAAESRPLVLIRGAKLTPSELGSSELIREPEKDLFR